jgi:hypothetical protein
VQQGVSAALYDKKRWETNIKNFVTACHVILIGVKPKFDCSGVCADV